MFGSLPSFPYKMYSDEGSVELFGCKAVLVCIFLFCSFFLQGSITFTVFLDYLPSLCLYICRLWLLLCICYLYKIFFNRGAYCCVYLFRFFYKKVVVCVQGRFYLFFSFIVIRFLILARSYC